MKTPIHIEKKTLPTTWLIACVVMATIAVAGWWLLKSGDHGPEHVTPVTATAPQAPPRPLNADGAPRSD